jgi:proline racemase
VRQPPHKIVAVMYGRLAEHSPKLTHTTSDTRLIYGMRCHADERVRQDGLVMPPAVSTTDYHTAGEPFRIVAEPPVVLPGVTVADRRVHALHSPDAQGLRELLCFEPRGHADMYGGFLVPPDDEGAHLGVLFWHKDGFSTAWHGTIALGVWAVDTGLVQAPRDGNVNVVIDVPSGRVTAHVHRDRGLTFVVDPANPLLPGFVLR